MKKKRIDFARGSNRKAQVTIFIIIALVVFFVFLFLILLTNQVKKDQLTQERENIFTKSFRKEALRIYLDDCLKDELENGLTLLGEQGRLWEGQIGGTKTFSSGENGIEFYQGGKVFNVFYGITDENNGEAYPCSRKSGTEPESEGSEEDGNQGGEGVPAADNLESCQYQYPDITVGFGNLNLRASTLTADLRRYLIESVEVCVGKYVSEEISDQVKVEKTELRMTVDIRDESIVVSAEYPLKLILGEEEFFQLSQFDFSYPTQFKKLLDAAIIFPLRMDQKYVDFEYTEETLKSPTFKYGNTKNFRDCSFFINQSLGRNYFMCELSLFHEKYKALSIVLEDPTPENLDDRSVFELENGDDVFVFTSPRVIQGKSYTFRIARQNRPPALDYISRAQCLGGDNPYDYLVIQGDEGEDLDGDGIVNEKGFGNITIKFNANDPDEEEEGKVHFLLESDSPVFDGSIGELVTGLGITSEAIRGWGKGIYNVTVTASDGFKEDKQGVRILVDRPINIGVSLDLPYTFLNADQGLISYATKYPPGGDLFVVSKEDPVFVNVIIPDASEVAEAEMFLKYTDIPNNFEQKYLVPNNLVELERQEDACFSFPGKGGWISQPCRLKTEFNFPNTLDRSFDRPFGKETKEESPAKVEISFNSNYCGVVDKNKFTAVNVKIEECVPHINLEYPFAFPYDDYYLEPGTDKPRELKSEVPADADLLLDTPFEATHNCCEVTGVREWGYAPADTSCFVNPVPGCYTQTQIEGHPIFTDNRRPQNFYWEQQIRLCGDAGGVVNSGNKCEGRFANELYRDQLWCGIPNQNECGAAIDADCQDRPAFGISENGKRCFGKYGCERICLKEIVYSGAGPIPDINEEATKSMKQGFVPGENPLFPFACGCVRAEDIEPGRENELTRNVCDPGHDGDYEGRCSVEGECLIS